MSDIPVGSPPVPPGRHAAPSGWYPDPVDPQQERYWDGWQWSRNTRSREGAAPPQPQGPPGYGPSGYGPPGGQPYGFPPSPQAPGNQQPYAGPPYPGPPYAGPTGYGQQPLAPLGGKQAYTADGVPLAGWWWRVLAVVIDAVIVSILTAIPALPIYRRLYGAISDYLAASIDAAQSGQTPPAAPTMADLLSASDQTLLVLISLAVESVFAIVFLRWKAATPGKLVCGLRVVPVDRGRSADKLAWSSILPRVAVWVLPGAFSPLLIVQLIDVLFPLWQPKRQALHDLVARTQVVRLQSRG